ncbi:hypothetical protein [uncultured Sphaerochaeta sp.]|uniref:hypothetical protein n=1 Tax=uncultured Sphaerochaeta sp. TaxID=886478 RepID=UPI002A0A1D99|nr:hypothetical protein [uncultured Sphaerochaeta sp.]
MTGVSSADNQTLGYQIFDNCGQKTQKEYRSHSQNRDDHWSKRKNPVTSPYDKGKYNNPEPKQKVCPTDQVQRKLQNIQKFLLDYKIATGNVDREEKEV